MNWSEVANPEKCALIVVDMQNDFCHETGALALNGADVSGSQAIVPAMNQLIEEARNLGVVIYFIKTTHDETTNSPSWIARRMERKHVVCATGTWGTEFYGVSATDQDVVITKHRYSAFIGTDLELRLRATGKEVLLLTGVATNICVESTLRDGFMLNFYTVLVPDCCATSHGPAQESTIENVRRSFGWVAGSQEVIASLQKCSKVAEPV
ncbi:MAG: isochorismatase [Bacilli bacterium]|nr:isochorismatase [Bacilli bacterium]